ncbi:hypothetical protein RQP46_001910 [Phenoliferia psychrophenolica]
MIPSHPPTHPVPPAQPAGIANAATTTLPDEVGGRAAHSNAGGGAVARGAKAGVDEELVGHEEAAGGKRAHVGLGADQSGVVGGGGGQK